MSRGKLASLAVVGLSAAACGGAGSESAVAPSVPASVTTPVAEAPEPGVESSSLLPSQVDLRGAIVVPEAEIDSNPLPPVVVDDLSAGRKVNFRNLVPQDLPVLLWMWAPS